MPATIGRIQGVISSGVSPGVNAFRSAISSSVMSSSSGLTSSAMAIPLKRLICAGYPLILKNGPAPAGPARERSYFRLSAKALPSDAFDVCAPAQNGTAISAKSFWDCQTVAKNSFSAAFFSRDAFAAFMYSEK